VDLDFEARHMLFSMPAPNGRWQVFEMNADGSGLRQVRTIEEPDVDNYDACYLPDGNLLFTSTAPFIGVPCVTGADHVSNLFRLERETGAVRQLGFEQDHDWCPTVLPNGRVLYLRWEYSDIPHYVSRILFTMNPDGTGQAELYGSNSYWPNSTFYARPLPGDSSRFVGVVGGHHDNPRMGELVLFDATRGKREADGAIQRIPGFGKRVEPVILDGLTAGSWPKYLHPYPLSDKYFLTACKPTPASKWGIYLVDVFDNITLIKELDGYALLEPLPLRPIPRPPVIASKVALDRKDALVYVADIYRGDGLKGVPRGTIKQLRLLTYHFCYHGMGGQVNRVGIDGPWDVKRIVGTVPVEPDGSAFFRIPANTPVAVQPLDEKGQALQLMRSWMTAMPGETLSCVGCHEPQGTTPPMRRTFANRRGPSDIMPWYGPTRGFSFAREVQPVLDRHCLKCHDGAQGSDLPDFRARPATHPPGPEGGYRDGSVFTPSYLALKEYVRNATIESDMHLLMPGEFAADTTRLVQMLRQGHHGVQLDAEGWDRVTTWVDLNTPAHGTWHEIVGEEKVNHFRDRRREMMRRYAGRDEDPEEIITTVYAPGPAPSAPPDLRSDPPPECPGWPFDADEARRRQAAEGGTERTISLGAGAELRLVRVPAGEFVMGDAHGGEDERPLTRVRLARAFWMGKLEITNAEYAQFDPRHDSRHEEGDYLQFGVEERGYPVNGPQQPVCRVSWDQAMAFCRWLGGRVGETITLPTEAQWEWACRAGTATPSWWGDTTADFARFGNLADVSLKRVDNFAPWALPWSAIYEWRPAVATVNDGYRVAAPVGSFRPNPWGLYDTLGNVAEWTRDGYRPGPAGSGDKVVRGGSWYDKPERARSGFRQAYPAYRGVYDVGFRVVVEAR
jgi:formylglycine-generating enzyme required for sulfatase activity